MLLSVSIDGSQLDPNNSNARHWYGQFLDRMGRLDEALAQYKHALGLDPLNLTLNMNLAGIYEDKGQYDQALDQFKKTFEIDPNYASAHDNLSRLYRKLGKYELWLEEWRKGATLNKDPDDLSICEEVTRVYAKSGFRSAQIRNVELLKRLAQRRYVDPAIIAYESALLGDKEQVFFWLEKAYSEKSGALQVHQSGQAIGPFPLRSSLHRSHEADGPSAVILAAPVATPHKPKSHEDADRFENIWVAR